MPVSLIFTVLNEAPALPRLLDSLAAQTRLPDEVIVCDGGSQDDSVEILRAEKRFPIRVIEAPGANISRGRNLAIAASSYPFIACLDAGVRLDAHWLENLTRIFTTAVTAGTATSQASTSGPQWVGGFFLPDAHTTFEISMGATVLPSIRDIDPFRFLPSSRSVAYQKSAWQAVGGYPEWLDYCEDLVYDLRLRAAFGPCVFVPDALVYFRPRSSLRSFGKQYFLYARGDGKANLWLKRHLVRYGIYLVALPLLLAGALFAPGIVARFACLALLLLGGGLYTRTPYRRLGPAFAGLATWEKCKAILLVPVIRVVGDIAKMIGYPVGVAWRLRHRNVRGTSSAPPA